MNIDNAVQGSDTTMLNIYSKAGQQNFYNRHAGYLHIYK